jgi:3-oxoacyl-[acyl-carrier protein] reductase
MKTMVTSMGPGLVRGDDTEAASRSARRSSPASHSADPSDFLLTLGESLPIRQLMRLLGLPVQLPRRLQRTAEPWPPNPLDGASVVVGGVRGPAHSALEAGIARAVKAAGGAVYVASAERGSGPALVAAEAEAARRLALHAIPANFATHALVFDATRIESPSELRALYDFFSPLLGRLMPHGRVVVLGLPSQSAPSPTVAASRGALDGFVRSLAKEIGRKGATAQLLILHPGAEERFEPVLRFLLSEHSAFVTGQSLPLSATVRPGARPVFVRPLAGKVALVTGAGRGIGAATAKLLSAEGAHVVCLDRAEDEALLGDVARSLGGTPLVCDVSDPAAPTLIAQHLTRAHGGVDVVVHNAGITRDKTLARMQPKQWDETLDINLTAVTRIDAALDRAVIRDGARLIYLSSVVGIAGTAGQTNYSSAKAGLIAYVRSRADRLAARGICVNAVAPGFIETRLTAAMPTLIREVGRRLNSLNQGGTPEDVGNVITFLASPGAAAITGAVVRVCGGALLGA